jgi:hypothetical protein
MVSTHTTELAQVKSDLAALQAKYTTDVTVRSLTWLPSHTILPLFLQPTSPSPATRKAARW